MAVLTLKLATFSGGVRVKVRIVRKVRSQSLAFKAALQRTASRRFLAAALRHGRAVSICRRRKLWPIRGGSSRSASP
jgi:hypothetical protein